MPTKTRNEKKRWIALEGRLYSRRGEYKKGSVEVVELPKAVHLPDDNNKDTPYGIPIDFKQAIKLIDSFFEMLPEVIRPSVVKGEKIFFSEKDFSEKREEIIDALQKLVEILRKSCAITIDKSILLKTLSQPACEGIRFYLCKKTVDSFRKKNVKEDFISIVTVGVDENGKDHLYDAKAPSKNDPKATAQGTTSLLSEYGHPPTSKSTFGKSLKGGVYNPDYYVLLGYALE